MASLPTTFTYNSFSSVHSVRNALASYYRSQYYPGSNVQTSDNDESPLSEPFDSSNSLDRPYAERHLRRSIDTPRQSRRSSHAPETPPQAIGARGRSIRARASRENTPLLRRAAPFAVFSQPAPASVVVHKSPSHADDLDTTSQSSIPISSDMIVDRQHDGKSTYNQTLFNCIALLLGIGMLSEPLAFAYAGWFEGTVLIIFFGTTTCYTIWPQIIHSDEYVVLSRSVALSVALVTLAADSLEAVWPAHSTGTYKVFSFFILAPTAFMPLSILSLTSLLGITSTLLVIVVVLVDGFSKPDYPGSLWSPAATSLFPGTLGQVGVTLGLLMAGFDGHIVIPSLARDMKDPSQFNHMANRAFFITTFIYTIIGSAGYLMFGNSVSDEISKDLLATPGYNTTLNQLVMWLLVITPLSKFALSTRPLNIILESILGLEITSPDLVEGGKGAGVVPEHQRNFRIRLFAALGRIMVPILSISVSILVPQFSALMAFLGAFFAFVMCVIGPISAKIVMTRRCQWYDGVLLVISTSMMVCGTLSAFWMA